MNAFLVRMAALSLASTFATGAFAQETINFGIISTESQQNLRTKWEPFLADMEKQTGLDIEPFFASDYAGVIEGMRFGKVQMGWFGNKSAMEAVDRAKGEVFAQTVPDNGEPGYYSLILAPKDSPLNSVEDILECDGSLNFGLGDPNSTSWGTMLYWAQNNEALQTGQYLWAVIPGALIALLGAAFALLNYAFDEIGNPALRPMRRRRRGVRRG